METTQAAKREQYSCEEVQDHFSEAALLDELSLKYREGTVISKWFLPPPCEEKIRREAS